MDEDGGQKTKTEEVEEYSYSLQREKSSSIYSDVYSRGNEKKRKLYRTLGRSRIYSTGIVYSHSVTVHAVQMQ